MSTKTISCRSFAIIAILLASQCIAGCALIDRLTGKSSSSKTPPPVQENAPELHETAKPVVPPPLNVEMAEQTEQIRKQADETIAAVQKKADELSVEVTQLRGELEAKEQKVQSLNASFQKQATVVIPPNSPLQYTPVIQIEGVAVLPRDGETIRIAVDDSVLFSPNAVQLLPKADEVLGTVIKEIRVNYPNNMIGIEGHADPILENPQNPMQAIELTSRKANVVALHLLEQKRVTTKQIKVTGYGAARPLVSGHPEKNNRIEFVVYP